MERYFDIRYEFDKERVWKRIDVQIAAGQPDYICVADGVVVNQVQRNRDYRNVVNGGMFAICDSGWVPMYLRWIYGIRRPQYCGPMIFKDLVKQGKYRMIFLGTDRQTLDALQKQLSEWNPAVKEMTFCELPFKSVESFDYPAIAKLIEKDGADLIWIALGAPKQDYFMMHLKPYLKHGVMIGVGAAFNFYSGREQRAPDWVVRMHLEFLYRIFQSPKKQLSRCKNIVATLPGMLWGEWQRKKSYG